MPAPDLRIMTPSPLQRLARPARQFIGVHMAGVLVPIAAGFVAFGWRALLCVTLVLLGAAGGWAAWRLVGRRGRHVHLLHTLWLALLLAALSPAHLAADFI